MSQSFEVARIAHESTFLSQLWMLMAGYYKPARIAHAKLIWISTTEI